MSEYRMDKTAFKINTFEEADRRNIFDKNTSVSERLKQIYFLISQAYGFSLNTPPKMDKTAFVIKKRD